MNEMARLITREIPIHMNCCDRKSLLLLNLNVCDVMFIKCYLFLKIRELQIAETNYDFNSTNLCPLTLNCVNKNIYKRSSSRSKVLVDRLTEKDTGEKVK
jgi:hypothetical protein